MSKNSFSAEQIGYFGKPTYTEEGIKLEQLRMQRMQELGIERHDFSSSGNDYTDDEKEAIKLIYENKEVPKELAARIKEYHSKNNSDIKRNTYKMKRALPEQISKILGIKEKDQW